MSKNQKGGDTGSKSKAGAYSHVRSLTPSEIESLREDIKATYQQMKGRFYLEDGKVRLRPKKS